METKYLPPWKHTSLPKKVAQDVLKSQLSVCALISSIFCIAIMLEHFIACQYNSSDMAYMLDSALNKNVKSIL